MSQSRHHATVPVGKTTDQKLVVHSVRQLLLLVVRNPYVAVTLPCDITYCEGGLAEVGLQTYCSSSRYELFATLYVAVTPPCGINRWEDRLSEVGLSLSAAAQVTSRAQTHYVAVILPGDITHC